MHSSYTAGLSYFCHSNVPSACILSTNKAPLLLSHNTVTPHVLSFLRDTKGTLTLFLDPPFASIQGLRCFRSLLRLASCIVKRSRIVWKPFSFWPNALQHWSQTAEEWHGKCSEGCCFAIMGIVFKLRERDRGKQRKVSKGLLVFNLKCITSPCEYTDTGQRACCPLPYCLKRLVVSNHVN